MKKNNYYLNGNAEITVKNGDDIENIKISELAVRYKNGELTSVLAKAVDLRSDEEIWSSITVINEVADMVNFHEIRDWCGHWFRCSPEYSIYTVNRGYVQARDLVDTDVLRLDHPTTKLHKTLGLSSVMTQPTNVYSLGTECGTVLVHGILIDSSMV